MYRDQFEQADTIYWLPTYLSREDPDEHVLIPEDLIQNITNKTAVQIAELDENLWNTITEARKSGNLVLCMGAGTIDAWVRQHLASATQQ